MYNYEEFKKTYWVSIVFFDVVYIDHGVILLQVLTRLGSRAFLKFPVHLGIKSPVQRFIH